jgi:hypothetical protein
MRIYALLEREEYALCPRRHPLIPCPVPETDDIFRLPNTNRAPTNLWFTIPLLVIRAIQGPKLVPDNCQDEILPQTICNAFSNPYYPLPSINVERVLPNWSSHSRME